MPKIIHLSYDLRDAAGNYATTAVSDLIEVSRRLGPVAVVDLVRVRAPQRERIEHPSSDSLKMDVFGLPGAGLLRVTAARVFHTILAAHDRGLIDLNGTAAVHAHKAVHEGYVGYLLSRRLGVPLLLTLRQTDPRVLRYRPDLRPLVRRILSHASLVFYPAPYLPGALARRVGQGFFRRHVSPHLVFLPNIVERRGAGGAEAGRRAETVRLITVMRMTRKWLRRKNLKRLLRALRRLADRAAEMRIIGDGAHLPAVRRWVSRLGLQDRVTLVGRVPNREIDRCLQEADAFVLPSRSETFGMVYAEALLNGLPILYSQGTGFDGIFENVGVAVQPRSVGSIADGLVKLIDGLDAYRQSVSSARAEGAFKIFSAEHACRTYAAALARLLGEDAS